MWDNPLVIAKHEAEWEIRLRFQLWYGDFWRCQGCGGRISHPSTILSRCGGCGGYYVRTHYAPPAPRSR